MSHSANCFVCKRDRATCEAEPCQYARTRDRCRIEERDESDYPNDLSDIQPFERTTSYPWGHQ